MEFLSLHLSAVPRDFFRNSKRNLSAFARWSNRKNFCSRELCGSETFHFNNDSINLTFTSSLSVNWIENTRRTRIGKNRNAVTLRNNNSNDNVEGKLEIKKKIGAHETSKRWSGA